MNDDSKIELNPDAEERYLAALLLTSGLRALRDEALAQIGEDDFWNGRYGGLWGTAQRLSTDGKHIDRRSLITAADGKGVEQTLDTLAAIVPRPADFPRALAEVKRCGQLRRLVAAAQRIQQRAFIAEDPSQALAWAFDEINALSGDEEAGDTVGYAQLLANFDDAMRTRDNYSIIPTPWAEVNGRIAGGLHGGRFYVIGARPGEGKSIIGHNLAEHAAAKGHPALVFSVEMGDLEVTGRMIANGATIELSEIARRDLTTHSWTSFQEYANRAANYPLFVNDRADLSLSYIKAECRAQKRRTGLDVVVVDYLQLIKSDRNVTREQQVAHISRSLKELSRELDAAVIVPAQLNRKATDRDKPTLADLRESGSIEADADVVMLLARQYFTSGDQKGMPNGVVTVDIAKNRHGRVGALDLTFRGNYSRIS